MPNFVNLCAWIANNTGTSSDYNFLGGIVNAAIPADVLTDGLEYGYSAYYSDGVTVGYEAGLGTWTASGTTFSRDTIESSSNSDAAVDWAAGSKIVEIVLTAGQLNASLARTYGASSESVAQYGSLTGLINASNTLYTLPRAYIAGSTRVYVNGVLRIDYAETDPAAGTITFDTAPSDAGPVADEIVVFYDG